jgi:hypothetical protein
MPENQTAIVILSLPTLLKDDAVESKQKFN